MVYTRGGRKGAEVNSTRTIRTISLIGCAILIGISSASAKEGFYLGLGLGGGIVGDTDPVSIEWNDGITGNPLCENPASDCVKTDFGTGPGAMIRIGYNILQVVSLESSILAHGSTADGFEGQGNVVFSGVLHPIGIANVVLEHKGLDVHPHLRIWDPYFVAGGGLNWGIYKWEFDGDDKGWTGTNFQWGLGLNAHVDRLMSIGLDLRWTTVYHDTWYFDYGDNITASPIGDVSSTVFTPMITFNLHVN